MLFLVVLFLIKIGFFSKNPISSLFNKEGALTYNTTTIGELVYKDTDGDTIPDWEEGLWGTDPTKKETTPGTPDTTIINKLKASQEPNLEDEQNLTETDKFSRELFSTITSLNQTGTLDQAVVDKMSDSLADQIKNPAQKKIYILADIKVISDESITAIKTYNNALDTIHSKYPVKENVMEVLQKFIIDENNVDVGALEGLTPIIKQTQGVIDGMLKVNVPKSLAYLHLNYINELQKFSENLNAIQLFDTDPIVALGGISSFEENIILIESAVNKLSEAIQKKLNS